MAINKNTIRNYMKFIKITLAVIFVGVFLFTNILVWAKEGELFSTAIENEASSSSPADNNNLAPSSRLNDEDFIISLTVAAICKNVEHDGSLDDKSCLNDVLARLDVGKNHNITILPYEVIIEIPAEGLAVRYFDPTQTNVVTPYSDISKLSTKVIGLRLNRQIIHRVKALPVNQDFANMPLTARVENSILFNRLKKLSGFYSPALEPKNQNIQYARYYHDMRVKMASSAMVDSITNTSAINVNRDIVDIISLCHDMGHLPFAAMGQRALNKVVGDFKYNEQDGLLQAIEILEKEEGISLPDSAKGYLIRFQGVDWNDADLPAELKIVLISDMLVGKLEDIIFALRMHLIVETDIPLEVKTAFSLERSDMEEFKTGDIDAVMQRLIQRFVNSDKFETNYIRVRQGVFTPNDKYGNDFAMPRVYKPVDDLIAKQIDLNAVMLELYKYLMQEYSRSNRGVEKNKYIVSRLIRISDENVVNMTAARDDLLYSGQLFERLNIIPSFKVRPEAKNPVAKGFPSLGQYEFQYLYPDILDKLEKLGLTPLDKTVHLMSIYYDADTPYLVLSLCDERTEDVINGTFLYDMLRKLGKTGPLSLHLGFPMERFDDSVLGELKCDGLLGEEDARDRIINNALRLKERLREEGFGDKQVLLENTLYFPENRFVCIPDFINRVLDKTGCGLLLDLGHAVVSAKAYKGEVAGGGVEEPIEYVKKLVNEKTVRRLGEVHISIPAYIKGEGVWVHGGHRGTPYGSLYVDTPGSRAVKELLFYILDLRKRTNTESKFIINLETDDDFRSLDAVRLTEVLKEWENNDKLKQIYESGESGRPAMKVMPAQITCNEQLKDLFEFKNGAWDWKRGDGLTLLGGLPFEGSTRKNFDEILSLLRIVEPKPQNLYTHRIDTLNFTIAELIPNTDRVNDIQEINGKRQDKLNRLQGVCAGIGPIKVRFCYKDLAITEGGDIVALGYVDNNGLFALRGKLQNDGVPSKPTKIVHVTIGRIFDEKLTPEKLEEYKRVISELRERKEGDGKPQLLGEITINEVKVRDQRFEKNELRYGGGHTPIPLTEQGRASTSSASLYFDYAGINKNLFSNIVDTEKPPALLRVPIEAIEFVGVDNIKDFLATFQEAPNGYAELYHMSGIGEVNETVYQKYGFKKKSLPDDFRMVRENTVTLFPAFKGEEINQSTIVSRLGDLNVTPANTILSPIGLQHDPAGLIRATILGLKIMNIARQAKEGRPIDKDAVHADILNQLRDVLDLSDFKNFDLTPDDIIALATGNINSIITALKKLIKLLPIMPIDAEELRQIYEHARQVLIAA